MSKRSRKVNKTTKHLKKIQKFTRLKRERGYMLLATLVVIAGLVLAVALISTQTPHKVLADVNYCGSRATDTPPATFDHVIWIWDENHSLNKVINTSAAPNINMVATDCGLATNYHNITHPSMPNYVAATSGSTQGITKNCNPANSGCEKNVPSLFSQLDAAGMSWKYYGENMPANCTYADSGTYAANHNPVLNYSNLKAECALNDVPMGTTTAGALYDDLTNNTLPAFSFLVPDSCNDMEGCSVTTADNWLGSWLPVITSSPAYQNQNTVIFITWDEGTKGTKRENCSVNTTDNSCNVATIAVSPYVPTGTKSATLFNHYSLLGTTETLLGLNGADNSGLLSAAAGISNMDADFHL